MKVHAVTEPPNEALSLALDDFERAFRYPLGPGRFFRISHGRDYSRFFRAMGEAVCLVCERDGQVLGVLGLALRRVVRPDGNAISAVYFGDLKVAREARGGRVLPTLAKAAADWIEQRATAAFAVVMDGTPTTPDSYTGRLAIPLFRPLAKVSVLKLTTMVCDENMGVVPLTVGDELFDQLNRGRYSAKGGDARLRSQGLPTWFALSDRSACGMLEDTADAKHLLTEDGEMHSGHLSYFGYRDVTAARAFVRSVLGEAHQRGYPALFLAVPPADAVSLKACLADVEIIEAPATVFGSGFPLGETWNINTSEI